MLIQWARARLTDRALLKVHDVWVAGVSSDCGLYEYVMRVTLTEAEENKELISDSDVWWGEMPVPDTARS